MNDFVGTTLFLKMQLVAMETMHFDIVTTG